MSTREITYMEALREGISQEMRADNRVFMIGEDIGVYGGAFGMSRGMFEEFGPERIIDTPISEEGIAGALVGSALAGLRPVGEMMFSDFMTLATDQLFNQAAKIPYMFNGEAIMPIVMRAPTGSGTGAAQQHSQSMESLYLNIPGLKVVEPTTPYDVKGLIISSIRDNSPVIFFEPKLLYKKAIGPVPEESYTIPLGVADVKRVGSELTIFATGQMVPRSLEAAEELEKEGMDIEVIDPRTLRPLDKDAIIKSVIKTGKLLIVHEGPTFNGLGGEIAATVAGSESFGYLDAPIRRLGGREMPIPYNRTLEYNTVPQTENIVEEARNIVKGLY